MSRRKEPTEGQLRPGIVRGALQEQRRQAESAVLSRVLEGDPRLVVRQLRASLAREIAALEDVLRICETEIGWRGIVEIPGRLERWGQLAREVRHVLELLRAQHAVAEGKLRAE